MTKVIEDQTDARMLFVETPHGRDDLMINSVCRNPELILISELCRELAKLGLNVGLSDARPAVAVRTSQAAPMWISLNDAGEFFEWSEGKNQYPATDPVGAAAVISEHVKRQGPGPGDAL